MRTGFWGWRGVVTGSLMTVAGIANEVLSPLLEG